MKRILVVEDNENLAYGLQNNLEIEGYRVDIAPDGPSGLEKALNTKPDLVVLDLMLPGLDGFQVLRRLRKQGREVPVLILSARGEELDKVRGFRFGADQYLTKPFSVLELLARVESLLRKPDPTEQTTPMAFGDIEVFTDSRRVVRKGVEVALAPKEYDLLLALLVRGGAVASRSALNREVWGYADGVMTRTLDTHIGELRRKLEENPAHPCHILTVRKAGYRLDQEGSSGGTGVHG